MHMKYLLCLFFLTLTCIDAFSQDVFAVDSVVVAPGKNADEIYSAVLRWIATNVDAKSSQAAVSYDDAKHTVTSKAVISFDVKHLTWYPMSGVIYCTIDVAARDGRFRVRFSDFVHDSSTPDQITGTWDEGLLYKEIPADRNKGLGGKQHREVYKRAKKRIAEWTNHQINTLVNAINSHTSISDDDW